MQKIIYLLIIFNLFLNLQTRLIRAQLDESTKEIKLEGRITIHKRENTYELILYAEDKKVYNIKGDFKDLLKNIALELGEKNWIKVWGENKGLDMRICQRKTSFDNEGKPLTETSCYNQYLFYVTKIEKVETCDKPTPSPELITQRETETSQKIIIQSPDQIFWIIGKIEKVDIKSPVKNVEIVFFDKDKNLIRKNIIINKETKIVKSVEKEPMYLALPALKKGQEILVEYTLDKKDQLPIALAITILKE